MKIICSNLVCTRPYNYTKSNNNKNICSPSRPEQQMSLPNAYYPVFQSYNIKELRDFSVDEYNSLSPEYIQTLRDEYNENGYKSFPNGIKRVNKKTEELHDVISDFVIDGLDNKYGEDNWVLISLGRSVSSVAQVVGYKVGEDRVKQLPMSNAGIYSYDDIVDEHRETRNLERFKEYLSSIGLSKEDLDKSDKHFVLIDYCVHGKSLYGAYNLLNSDLVYDNNPRFHSESVMSFIPEEHPLRDDISAAFHLQQFKDLSGIDKCCVLGMQNKSFVDPDTIDDKTKLLRFKLLDNVMRNKKD